MKNHLFFLLSFSLSLLLLSYGCQGPNKADTSDEMIVIDLTKKHEEISLKLEDFLDDIRLIRLETNEHSLLSHFYGYVGDQYIIAMDFNNRILLFSADGRYIRTIAQKGKGPGEFNHIDAWDVDDSEQFLYYHDMGKNYINKHNLNNGKYEENIPFSNKGYLNGMASINDTLLAILPGMFSEYGYLYFYQTTGGEIIAGKEKDPVPHPGAWAGMSPIFRKAANHSIFFQPSDCDTVYVVNEGGMQAHIIFIVPNPQKNGATTVGTYGGFIHQEPDRILLNKGGFESHITSNSSSFRMLQSEYLFYYPEDKKTHNITSLHYDHLGIEINNPRISHTNDKYFVIQFPAIRLQDIIKETLENNELSASKRDSLMQLYGELSENDNPILITGTMK